MTPEQYFAELLDASPSQPFVTYYDEATGERSELSVRSLANWVAKTHFLLVDELGLGAGDTALIALPAHWISVPALLGCLTAGLSLSSDSGDVAFVSPATVGSAADVPDVYAIAPDSAAVGFGDAVPAGAVDFVTAVRPQADAWGGVRFAATDATPCVDGLTRSEVVSATLARASALGVPAGGRVLTTRSWESPSDWLDTLLVPLVVGGSVVYMRNAADDVVARRMQQERAVVQV